MNLCSIIEIFKKSAMYIPCCSIPRGNRPSLAPRVHPLICPAAMKRKGNQEDPNPDRRDQEGKRGISREPSTLPAMKKRPMVRYHCQDSLRKWRVKGHLFSNVYTISSLEIAYWSSSSSFAFTHCCFNYWVFKVGVVHVVEDWTHVMMRITECERSSYQNCKYSKLTPTEQTSLLQLFLG